MAKQDNTSDGEHVNSRGFAEALRRIFKCRDLGSTYLDLGRMGLTSIPPEIAELTKLTELELCCNELTTLPPQLFQLTALTHLWLYENQLSSLPRQIIQLKNLKTLFLHGNPALRIPESVLGPTVKDAWNRTPARAGDILNFYFEQLDAAAEGKLKSVQEIKVMLVGRGGAGKTSLRRFFMGQPHNVSEKETPGITLETVRLHGNRGEISMHLWDFAGQEITHALHQFFLTEGCIYVLVLDPRSNTEMHDAEYWLRLLRRYAGNSPVLLALNHQDARKGGYDVDRFLLQEQFSFIHSFTRTECESREGCDELKERLLVAVESLKETEPPHLQVPETWLNIMRACAGKPNEGNRSISSRFGKKLGSVISQFGKKLESVIATSRPPHMTLDEFRLICATHGEGDSKKQESLARLLHKLGVVLHFVDEPRLRDTAVLDPHWVTDGVYRLLRCNDGPKSDGVLSLEDALDALPGDNEPEARFLLRLMERFEMCFPLEDHSQGKLPVNWLVPGALDQFQPEGVTDQWKEPQGVRLRYVYDALPEGVLPRFIVRTYLLSEGHPRWRNGVVLELGRSRALVRRGGSRNHVEVTAFGSDSERLRLLEIIQGNFERIHADLPDPKPYIELELAGLPGVFRHKDDLEATELEKTKLVVKSGKSRSVVDPRPELDRTSDSSARLNVRRPLRAFVSYSHKDMRAKATFRDNLTVLQQKKFIAPWHDGLIEPGMRWKDEVEENLANMDIFVGLLTTAFLASDFIQSVELKAARERLGKDGKDFLFVLILVDDISLEGLQLREYQVLKPGGKAVSKHASLRLGFDKAQKELETLIREKMRRNVNHQLKRKIDIGAHMIEQTAPSPQKALLEKLLLHIKQSLESNHCEQENEAKKISDNLLQLINEATNTKPDRRRFTSSAQGILEIATWLKDRDESVGDTLKKLGESIWSDFFLQGTRK